MKLNQLSKIPQSDYVNIVPGFAIAALLSAIPLIINSIAPIVGLIKSSFSISGEIKDKTNSYKWDNSKTIEKASPNSLNKYISF
ncbi:MULTISPECIES: hypothetical protein [unclassified Mycoplasma]|uniref:hypothetical protein n=1 Tax=unclassified Mycoplasma TaxID=2683645 RepID=UPI00211C1B95|nr:MULTISPECIES: hypothetical protein [unclassified Mycoplasma]UUM20022.1 hypothetical protein NPA11_01165 [Mycoplasma sp. 1578d]UUM25003.1 hypothetical protein NPA12_01150 [Mycoplasma sp. 3686d]